MKKPDATTVLYRHIARYMRTRGWLFVISGPISIEDRAPSCVLGRKFKYRWVLDFVGKQIPRPVRKSK